MPARSENDFPSAAVLGVVMILVAQTVSDVHRVKERLEGSKSGVMWAGGGEGRIHCSSR